MGILDVQQSGGEEKRERVTVDPTEETEVPNSAAKANFLVKFGGSKHAATMNVVTMTRKTAHRELKKHTLSEYSSAAGDMQPIVVFDCRGLEPTKWHPNMTVEVHCPTGTVFKDVDLSEAEDGW